MTPIKKVDVDTDINMVQVLCHTCWSAGKVVFQFFNGAVKVPFKIAKTAVKAARKHNREHKDHDIKVYDFHD